MSEILCTDTHASILIYTNVYLCIDKAVDSYKRGCAQLLSKYIYFAAHVFSKPDFFVGVGKCWELGNMLY